MKYFLFIFLALSGADAANAAANQAAGTVNGPVIPTTTITWADAVKRTESENLEIAAARENLRAAEAKKSAAYSGFLPSVNASVGYEATERSGTSSVATITGTGWTAGVNANWNLFAGFLDEARVKRAEADRVAAEEALTIARAKVSSDLRVAFEAVAYSRDYTKLTGQILKRRDENLRLVQLRYESGRENKGSVLLAEAYLEQAKLNDLQARNATRTSSTTLARIIVADTDAASIEVIGNVPISDPSTKSPDFSSLVLMTPDYLQAVEQAKSLDQARRVAAASFYPTLDLSTSVTRRGTEFLPTETQTKAFGVSLNIPLFSGGSDYNAYRASVAAAAASVYTRDNTLRDLRRKLEQSWTDYVESIAKLRSDESFRKAAIVRSEVGRAKYNNGLLSFDDWDIIENDLITREKTVLSTRRDRVGAEAAWEAALGKGVW